MSAASGFPEGSANLAATVLLHAAGFDYSLSSNANIGGDSWTISRLEHGAAGPGYVVAVVYGEREARACLSALGGLT